MTPEEPHPEQETITVHELLERSARAGLELQREDGSFPPGRNGVYDEQETPVRTTANWLTTLSKVYEITGDDVFDEAANDAADYLLSDEARPYGYTFHSRRVEGKDRCDGLVGQAAPIRALACAGESLNRSELVDLATDVFMLPPYDPNLGIWKIVEIDGSIQSFDRTLNHQLLYAAAGATLVATSNMVAERVTSFLNNLGEVMGTHPDGLVMHYIRPPVSAVFGTVLQSPRDWSLIWNEIAAWVHAQSSEFRRKEVGYHFTVLAALSWLRRYCPDHDIWDHSRIRAARSFVTTEEYEQQLYSEHSKYGSMLPGITHAQYQSAFEKPSTDELRKLVELDIHRKYDPKTGLLTKNTPDHRFQASLVYRINELENVRITL